MPRPAHNSPNVDRRREFEQLARQYERDLFAAAMRLTGSRQEAEDLIQEALVSAYLGFDSFELGTNFRAWMLRILRNTHINRYRKTQRSVSTVDLEELTEEPRVEASTVSPTMTGIEAEVLGSIPDEGIVPALGELPEEFRTAVVLSDIHQYSYEEIARELDIPLGTVRSRIFRGRKRLRESLAEYARQNRMI